MVVLDEEQTERALKMALAVNARQEREIQTLRMAPKAPLPSTEVMRKLELDLDKDGTARLVRVLTATVVTLRESKEGHFRSKRTTLARECEARAQEIELSIAMLDGAL